VKTPSDRQSGDAVDFAPSTDPLRSAFGGRRFPPER
jgi:hypothetical protein